MRSHIDPAPVVMPARDKSALARLGAAVRQRLLRDSGAYRVPTEDAEIFAVGDFLTSSECERFIAMVDASARPSDTFDPEHQARFRTSWSGDLDPVDPFVQTIERRIDDLLGLPSGFGETVQGQRYRPGQEFQGHHDWFYTKADYWPREDRMGGQRSWTAMIYLNDVEAGGATEFPHLGLGIAPKRGVLLTWNNAQPDGIVNAMTLHAAKPVERGVKYVITKWYRTRRWCHAPG